MGAKRQSQAIQELEQKLAGNPKSRAFSRLADLYRESGDLQGAVELCRAGLAEHPGYVTGRLVLARCYKEQGNLVAAADESLKVCAVDLRNPVALRMLADIYLVQGRAAVAGSLYAILSDMEPDNAELRVCAAKNKMRERGTAAEILGIKPAAKAPPPPAGYAQPAASAPAENDIGSQLDSAFDALNQMSSTHAYGKLGSPAATGLPPAALKASPEPAPAQDVNIGQFSGDDVVGQLDELFGGQMGQAPMMPPPMPPPMQMQAPMPPPMPPPMQMQAPMPPPMPMQAPMPPPMPAPMQMQAPMPPPPMQAPAYAAAAGPDGGHPSGDDIAGQLDALFGEDAQPESLPASMPTNDIVVGAAPGPEGQLSGDDVAGQLDALFGGAEEEMLAESAAAEAGGPLLTEGSIMPDALSDDQISGDDLAGQLEAMFGEPDDAAGAAEPGGALLTAESIIPDEPVLTAESIIPDEPVLTAESIIPDEPVLMDEPVSMDESALTAGSTSMGEPAPADDEPAPAAAQDGRPSGDDVVGQLDALFGAAAPSGAPAAEPAPADGPAPAVAQEGRPSGDDVAGHLDALFGAAAAAAAVSAGKNVLTGEAVSTLTGESLPAAEPAPPTSGEASDDQLDQLFGGQSVLSADDIPASAPVDISPMAAPGGEASDDQLDQLFGGQSVLSADGIPASAPVDISPMAAPGGDATEDQLDQLFGGQSVLSAEDIPAGAAVDFGPMVPSGNAVVDQLDELFGGQTILPPAAMPEEGAAAAFGPAVPSGNAVVDQLDALFGGRTILPPAAMPEGMGDFAAEAGLPDDVTKELDLPASPEIDDALTEITGSDIEGQLEAMFGTSESRPAAGDAAAPEEMDEAALAAALEAEAAAPEEMDEAALAAALEAESASISGDDIESRLDTMFGANAAAGAPLKPAATDKADEPALVVDSAETAPSDEAAPPPPEAAKKLPSSIVLDENGVDVARTPTPEDIEDRIDTLFGKSDPSVPKEPLVIDEDEAEPPKTAGIFDFNAKDAPRAGKNEPAKPAAEPEDAKTATDRIPIDNDEDASFLNAGADAAAGGPAAGVIAGADVEARLAEMFGVSASDTTTAMTIEEVMAVDIDGDDGAAEKAIDSGVDADGAMAGDDIAVNAVDTDYMSGNDSDVSIEDVVRASNTVSAGDVVEVIDMDSLVGIKKTIDAENAVYAEDIVGVDNIVVDTDNAVVDTDNVIDTDNVAVDTDNVIDTSIDTDNAIVDTDNVIGTDNVVVDTDNIIDTDNAVVDTDNVIDTSIDTDNAIVDTDNVIGTDNVVVDTDNIIDTDNVVVDTSIDTDNPIVDTDNLIDTDNAVVDTGIDTSYTDNDAVNMNDILGIGDVINMEDEIGAVNVIDMDDEIRAANAIDMDDEIRAANAAKAINMEDDIDTVNVIDMEDEIAIVNAINADADTDADADDGIGAGPDSASANSGGDISDPFIGVDDVQDKIRQLFIEEGADPEPALGSGLDSLDGAGGSVAGQPGDSIFIGPDERDTPFDLPDHVLTSTLADIYYQQGQPQLALHIYERLVLRDPADARLLAKVEEIRGELRRLGEGGTAAPVEAVRPEKAPSASSGRKKKAPAAGARADTRPLAGVRIKKSAPTKKGKRAKP